MPSAAIADHDGSAPGAGAPPAGQAVPPQGAQAAPAPAAPVEAPEDDDGTSTLLIAAITAGLLAVGGGLAVVKQSRFDGPERTAA